MTNHSLSTSTHTTLPACLKDALEHIDTGVMAIDATRRITYVNAAICTTLTLAREALVGQELWTVFPDLVGTVFEQQYAEVMTTQAPVEFDAPYARLGLWLHVRAVPSADGLAIYLTDVTESKQVDTALQRTIELLTLAEHGGRLGSFETDFIAKTAWLSPELQALYGMEPGTWDGRHETWIRSIHPDDLPRIDACYARIFAAQAPHFDIDFRIRRPDGEERWISGRCCVTYNADGAPTRLVGVNIDITDRHQAEEALRDRTAFLELVTESIPQYLFWKDTASVYQGCNSLFAQAAGLPSAAEIIGKTDIDLGWQREKATEFRLRDEQVMTNGLAERHVEEMRQRADGSTLVLDVNKVPIRNADGEVVGILGIYDDITERKHAEEALCESESRFRAVFANAAVGMVVSDLQGYIVNANAAMQHMIGYTGEELRTQRFSDITHPDDVSTNVAFFQELLAGERENYQMEKRYLRKDGGMLWAQLTVSAMRADDGKPEAIVAVVEDIGARKRVEAERTMMLQVLDLVNTQSDRQELMRDICRKLQEWSGCSSIGLRLREGNDYPYYATVGFSHEFVLAETHLCSPVSSGECVRDACGNPVLECMCGNVLCGRVDPSLPFFTGHGSFWTNSTSQLLATTSEDDRQARTRNRCHGEGYESVALLPLRSGGETLGLLQLNDEQPDRFTPERITFLEGVADTLAIALSERTTQETLQRSEARYRQIVETAQEGIWLLDAESRTIYVNPQMAAILGYTEEEMLGRHLFDFMDEAGRAVATRNLERRQAGTGETPDFPFRHKDGRVVWTLISANPFHDDQGNYRGTLGMITDITARKQAEEALRASERRERERSEELAALLDAVPVPVFIAHDPDCLHITGNRAADELLRNPRGAEASLSAPEDAKPRHFTTVKDGRELRLDELPAQRAAHGEIVRDFEFSLAFDDGTIRHVLGSGTPLLDDQGRPRGAVHVLVDISERKQMEVALREIDHAKDEFLAVLSHELQTPLTSMLGFSQHAMEQDTLETYRKTMPIIQRNAKRQARLVNELLDMSKLLQGRVECQPVTSDLNHLAMTIMDNMLPIAEGAGVSLQMQPAHGTLPVRVDPKRILVCIEHLIGNSIKFTPAGGEITLQCREKDDQVLLIVTDTGRGIEPAKLGLLFNPFEQVERDEAAGGLGLGLAVVRGYVEWHGGSVSADSSGLGQGSTFTIHLPRADANTSFGGGVNAASLRRKVVNPDVAHSDHR